MTEKLTKMQTLTEAPIANKPMSRLTEEEQLELKLHYSKKPEKPRDESR